MSAERIPLYSRFERFWHWAQALLVVILLATGFEIHGSWKLLGFERATRLHEVSAWSWLGLYAFIIFWHLTTGQWKHYVPTTVKLGAVARHYALGIFRGESHPYAVCPEAKHNPLQRLVYLGLAAAIIPFQMATGLLLLSYNRWPELGLGAFSLPSVAAMHVAGGFALLVFLIGHVYMITTGPTTTTHLKAMCTGLEEAR